MNRPQVLRNGNPVEPPGPFRALEKATIFQLSLFGEIERLNRVLAERYLDHHEKTCEALILDLQRRYTALHVSLQQSRKLREEIDGIIARKGEAPKPPGFDYTGYSVFPD